MASEYSVTVVTGGADTAGTDANVFITLIGTNGKSKEISLDNPTNNFEKEHIDVFNLSSRDIGNADLGEIKQIRIRHDNSGIGPGWFLNYVTVNNLDTDQVWTFPANRWLAKDEEDHKIDRTLEPLPGEKRENKIDGLPKAGVPIFQAAGLSLGWQWIDSSQKFQNVTGVVQESHIADSDFPTVHDSHDQNTHILVDPEFDYLLSIPNEAGEIEVEWETGIRPDELKGDGKNPIFPKWVWPSPGDRVWVNGNWILDVSHPSINEKKEKVFQSEIHPPRAFATMRDQVVSMPDTGRVPIRVTATDLYIHGDGGYVTQVLNDPTIIARGGDNDRDQLSPIDDDFNFDILLPPKPSDTAIFTASITDGPGNTVDIAPELDPDLANNKVHVHIPLEGSGISPSEVYARHINVGWAFPTTDLHHFRLTLTKMKLRDEMDDSITDEIGKDANLTFSWLNIDKAGSKSWQRLSDFAKGNMDDYDDNKGLGNGEMGFNGPTFDFYVADGQTSVGKPGQIVAIDAHAYDQDDFDKLFGRYEGLVGKSGIPTGIARAIARGFVDEKARVGTGDNDKYNDLDSSLKAFDGNITSDPDSVTGDNNRHITITPVRSPNSQYKQFFELKVSNPGEQYDLFFNLGELKLKPEEVNQRPIVNANGPYFVRRGGDISLSSAGSSDPDGSITNTQWDFDYDGSNFDVDATGESPTFSATDLNSSTRTLALRVIDNLGVPAIATSTLTIDPITQRDTSGHKTFTFNSGNGPDIIENFGGIGKGFRPNAATIVEVDTLKFEGTGLTARNLLLTQQGQDLGITFEGIDNTKVVLKDFTLENLDNLTVATGASTNLGNVLFDGQTRIQDSFDVFNADSTRNTIWNQNSVTFLNDLDNNVSGLEDSNDVINGQGGSDILSGLSGDDLLRGGDGNDTLIGGLGVNTLVGGNGEDTLDGGFGGLNTLTGGANADIFVMRRNQTQFVTDFQVGEDKFFLGGNLKFSDLSFFQVSGATAISVLSDNATIAVVAGVTKNILNSSSNFSLNVPLNL